MLVKQNRGTPRKIVNKTTGDAKGGPLTQAERQDSNGNEPIGAVVSADTNDARVTFDGTNPDQTDSVGHILTPGEFFELPSFTEVKELRWVSAAGATPSELQITLYY